jgi:hypothetical protein
VADTNGETTGEGITDKRRNNTVYSQMLADWFNEPAWQSHQQSGAYSSRRKEIYRRASKMKLLIREISC